MRKMGTDENRAGARARARARAIASTRYAVILGTEDTAYE